MGCDEFSVLAVQHIEEAIAVGSGEALVAVLVDERNDFVHTVKIPAFTWRCLEVPFDFAVFRINTEARGCIEIVALVAVHRLAGITQVAVPRGRVTGAEDERLGVLVV